MESNIVYIDDNDTGLKQAGEQSSKTEEKTKEVSAKADEASESQESTEENQEESAEIEASGDESEETQEEETEDGQEKKPKKLGGFKRKLAKLQSELSAKDQELAYLRELAKSKGVEEQPKKADEAPKDKPVRDNFESLEEYLEAVAEWKVEKKLADAEIKRTQENLKSETQKIQETYNQRLESVKKEIEDFDDVVAEFMEDHGDFEFSSTLQSLVYESEVGPKAVYELAKNPDLLMKLNKMSPLVAAKEFGKLEDKILATKKEVKEVKVKTSAKPPLKTISTQKAQVTKDLYDPELSFEEFDRLMSEKEAKQRQTYRRY